MIRRACWVLSVWFSVWGAAQQAKGESGSDAGQPAAPPAEPGSGEAGSMNCQHERYVVVGARDGFDPALAAEVRKDLAAELGPRGYGVCPGRAPEGELAAEIRLTMSEPTLVSIQIDDLVTGKRVWRDVPLTKIPAGGKALAIAIAADELLRASWAELDLPRREQRLEREPAPSAPAAPVPASDARASESAERRVVNARAAPASQRASAPRERRYSLGLWPGYTYSPKAWNAFGVELRGQGRPFGWGWIEGGAGGFGVLETAVPGGSVKARGLSAALSLGACARERGRVAACAGARTSVYWVQLRGQPTQGGQGHSDGVPALVLSAVGQLGLRLSKRFQALVELGLGAAPVSAVADDGARTLMALEGFVLSAALGVGFRP